MPFSYSQAIRFLESLETPERWRLQRMHSLVKKVRLNNYYSHLNFVHITGSNGKGSVSAMLYSILRQAGFSVGCYTSPHLADWRERFLMDGALVSRKQFARLVEKIKPFVVETKASQFEALTAMALLWFSQRKPDWILWEVGMGGRLDATNVVNAKYAAITSISLEHTVHLGGSISKIAWEKSKIIKPFATVTTSNSGIALKAIERECGIQKAKLVKTSKISKILCTTRNTKFSYAGRTWTVSLLGFHQAENAAVAIELAKAMGLDERIIAKGLLNAKWPGRMQIFSKKPVVVLDGAHNPDGVEKAVKSFSKLFGRKPVLVAGVLKDKEWQKMVGGFAKLKPTLVITTQPRGERSLKAEKLALEFKKKKILCVAVPEVKNAVGIAIEKAVVFKKPVFVSGSLYLVGEVLEK